MHDFGSYSFSISWRARFCHKHGDGIFLLRWMGCNLDRRIGYIWSFSTYLILQIMHGGKIIFAGVWFWVSIFIDLGLRYVIGFVKRNNNQEVAQSVSGHSIGFAFYLDQAIIPKYIRPAAKYPGTSAFLKITIRKIRRFLSPDIIADVTYPIAISIATTIKSQ